LRSDAFSLHWLLHPFKALDFLEQFYEAAPLVVSRGEKEYFADLPGLGAVDELLVTTVSSRLRPAEGERLIRKEPDGSLSEQNVRMTGNAAVDIQAVYRSYHDGFTVVINQMHRRSAAVGRLCRALQAALHHPVGANLYLTPARAQGFLPHTDTHDVFVLQLHGTKEWHVSSPSVKLPLARRQGHRQTLSDSQTFRLAPGDVLYLPRGFPHEALTGDSSSLHLTVGVYAFRWFDLLSNALQLIADEDVMLRSALPGEYLDEPIDMERVVELGRRVTAALEDRALIERARVGITSRLVTADVAAGRSRFGSLDALAGLTDESVIVRPPELLCLVRLTSEQATIEFAGNFVTGPRLVGPALQFVARHDQFAVGELPGELSPEDRIDLVKRLVSEGLLEVLST
jgi:bifunctional lysine-specific demethylase and histidyl-hydroxylase NO66